MENTSNSLLMMFFLAQIISIIFVLYFLKTVRIESKEQAKEKDGNAFIQKKGELTFSMFRKAYFVALSIPFILLFSPTIPITLAHADPNLSFTVGSLFDPFFVNLYAILSIAILFYKTRGYVFGLTVFGVIIFWMGLEVFTYYDIGLFYFDKEMFYHFRDTHDSSFRDLNFELIWVMFSSLIVLIMAIYGLLQVVGASLTLERYGMKSFLPTRFVEKE